MLKGVTRQIETAPVATGTSSKLIASVILIIVVVGGVAGGYYFGVFGNKAAADTANVPSGVGGDRENQSATSAVGNPPSTATIPTCCIDHIDFYSFGSQFDSEHKAHRLVVIITGSDDWGQAVMIETGSTINLQLWSSVHDPTWRGGRKKGDFIQELTSTVTEKDRYGVNPANLEGIRLLLDYKPDFTTTSSDYGWIKITLTTPDGQTFEQYDDKAKIG